MEDYYGLLGLSRWASPEQIERAYAAWERGFGEGKEEELTQREREAYEVLRDPVRRAAYHAELDGLGKEPVKKAGEHPRTGVGTGGGKAVTVQEAPQADPGKAAERERYVRQLEAELATYRAQPAAEEAEGWFGRGGRIWWVLGVAAVALLVGGWWLWGRGPAGNGPVPTLAVAHSYATPEDLLTKVQGDLEAGRCAEVIMEVDLFLRAPDFPLGGSPLAELIYLRAAAKAALRNDTGAVRDYTRAIEIDPNGQGKSYVNRGQVQRRMGRAEAAFADFNEAIRLDPADVLAYSGRAALYYELEDFDHAVRDYTYLCQLQPSVPMYRTWVGNCYYRSGGEGKACAAWRIAEEQGNGAAADSVARHCGK